ncbi:hypothetical protein AAC387_Pa09g2258 [Persea americana]
MGRMKIKIRRLETASARQITYSKRKAGLAKKAMELSVLCDIDVALVMFSPAGKPTSYIGGNKKVEILEILRKAFKKVGHEIDMERLLGDGYWTNPDEVETFPEIVVMEECLVESLNRLQKRKVVLEEQLLHQTLSQTQNCAWPPGQYFPRLNGRSQVDQKLVMTLSDFGGHGNARGAAGYLNMPFFNHAQLLNSMGPSYEAHPENHI